MFLYAMYHDLQKHIWPENTWVLGTRVKKSKKKCPKTSSAIKVENHSPHYQAVQKKFSLAEADLQIIRYVHVTSTEYLRESRIRAYTNKVNVKCLLTLVVLAQAHHVLYLITATIPEMSAQFSNILKHMLKSSDESEPELKNNYLVLILTPTKQGKIISAW